MGQAAFIYVRISSDREGAGLGVARQEKESRELAARLDAEVARVFADNDISAYSGKPRPGYKDMLKGLEAGDASVVLAWHTDRLHRSPKELEGYIDLCERHGVTTHTVRAGRIDLSTPSGRMTARTLGAVARYESEHKSDRVSSAYEQRIFSGKSGGHQRPFGFEDGAVTIRPSEAAEIAKAADAVLAGASLESITQEMNASGSRTSKGNEWTHSRLREMLLRPRNAGLLFYHGQEAGPAPWAAIIPEPDWRRLVRMLTDPSRRSSQNSGGRASALGSGLYVCGRCGAKMRISFSGQGSRVRGYRCGASNHLTQAAAPLDDFIERIIVKRLSRSDAAELIPQEAEDLGPVYAERDKLTGRLEELGAEFAAGDIDMVSMKRSTKDIRGNLAKLDERIAAAAARSPLAGLVGAPDVRAEWEKLDLSRQRTVMSALMTVVIKPARYKGRPPQVPFDTSRVRIDPPGNGSRVLPGNEPE